MNRMTRVLCCIAVGVVSISAQSFKQGDQLAQGGIGVVLPGVPGSMTLPPIGAGFEYGLHNLLSTGATFALSGVRDSGSHLVFSIAGRCNFHVLNMPFIKQTESMKKIDAYIGGLIGANVVTNSDSRLLWGVIAGCRYYFSDMAGVYLEAGRGIGWVNAGITARL